MNKIFYRPQLVDLYCRICDALDRSGRYLSALTLRLFMAYEIGESGVTKLTGDNWFADIQHMFLFPLNLVPAQFSWHMAMWAELLGAAALALGLAVRFSAFALMLLVIVAWHAVHADHGYNVCDNGFKLSLIYLVALLPLLFGGAGKFSLDYLIKQRLLQATN